MTASLPVSLRAERLMAHMQVLCKEIGPRPATSPGERQAAEYVKQALNKLSVEDIREQRFKSQSSLGWVLIPTLVVSALAMPLALIGGQWGKLLGGLLLLACAHTLYGFARGRPPLFQPLVARGASQNVIASISPAGAVKRSVFLVGHLDSNKQRLQFPPSPPALMKPLLTLALGLGTLSGILLLVDALLGRPETAWWQWPVGAMLLLALAGFWADEAQPHVEGANDNASAVAVLLGVAEAMQTQPLQHTGVTLLFTGCEEVGCVGMETYLEESTPPLENTYWIDLEMVGTGDLCYVTQHGITYLTPYYPAEKMVSLAARAAQVHSDLAVVGKNMLIIEEVANLRRRGYDAICIAGYDQAGFLPNWHRLSDRLENVAPDTLSRAARYTWALMQEIDALSPERNERSE